MKFSENWLRSLVDIPAEQAGLLQRLTLSGLEVAAAEPIGAGLAGVVVARILACAPHPDADRLQVCRVATGSGEVQIVCGAPNARAGLLAPLATLGATLPNGITIKAAKLRGVESQGMLCSAKELGIDADASGLMELPDDAPVGAPLATYLGLPDAAIEVELTPNRGDCLGMLGLADEVAAEFGVCAKPFDIAPVPAVIAAPRAIRLDAGADCPRYLGRAVRGVDMAASTPPWMVQRLRAAGVKPINVAVDVTSYVMLETGQPLHAFDESTLEGGIVVRHAREGEQLKLLDGSTASLSPAFLLVTDQHKALAVAGVMGGFDSRVTAATRDVFLEAAHFRPAAIMGRARKLGLATDAAFRFERGVDPQRPRSAIERATALLVELAGGHAGEVVEALAPAALAEPAAVHLRRARITRVLGLRVEDAVVERILTGLGMQVTSQADGWQVTPPSRRFDIEREEDLIEEVARIHGYEKLPTGLPAGAPPPPVDDESTVPVATLMDALIARDYQEAICYAFVDPHWLEAWQLERGAVPLANPLSAELASMRTSLLPGLVDALRRNRNRQQERVRLCENGVVFQQARPELANRDPNNPDSLPPAPEEVAMLAAVACGGAAAEQWGAPWRALDYYDLKGDLEALLGLGAAAGWSFDGIDLPACLHPGRGARILRDGVAVGCLGALHPALQAELELPPVYAFELRLDALQARAVPRAQALGRFPMLRRDIAIEVDEAVSWAQIASAIGSGPWKSVTELVLFDCFRGPGLQDGRKSLAMGLILQDSSRTLTDRDADTCVAEVVALLGREFGAQLRG